jgi:pimeloyl-ACP methyl ester carboxylesterase
MTSHVPRVAAAASRRAVLRGLTSAASALALCGCAGMAAGPRFDASALVLNPTLLVASTRKPVNGARAKPWFGTERGKMTVARATLTPPDDGRFSLASVGLADWNLEKIEPVAQIGDLIDPTAGGHDVLIYVHGYNTTFETAALDAARLSDGVKFVGETMVFSWPSRAGLLDYGYDRESAMWSRDALQQLLDGLIASPIVGHVHIVAHSIGTMLTMEALRQLYAQLGDEAANRVGAVVFASPMHAARLLRKRLQRVVAPAEPHLDHLRSPHSACYGNLPLARVGQPQASPTGEQVARPVKLCNAPATNRTIGSDQAFEPRPAAAEVAFRPFDGDSLLELQGN